MPSFFVLSNWGKNVALATVRRSGADGAIAVCERGVGSTKALPLSLGVIGKCRERTVSLYLHQIKKEGFMPSFFVLSNWGENRYFSNDSLRHPSANGKTAEKYYNKYIRDTIGREAICLPSTSPANAGWNTDKLVDAWQIIKTYLIK